MRLVVLRRPAVSETVALASGARALRRAAQQVPQLGDDEPDERDEGEDESHLRAHAGTMYRDAAVVRPTAGVTRRDDVAEMALRSR